MGKNWLQPDGGKAKYGNFINLPDGGAYQYIRQAFEKVINKIKEGAPNIILVAHVKDIKLDKNGAEFNALEIDLVGKLKRITASNADAIGYIYRKGDKNMISFKTTDEVGCGARSTHLRNKEFVISEILEDGTYKTYWDKIYI